MSLVEAPRALHSAQHFDSKVTGSEAVFERITLHEIPSQSRLEGPAAQIVAEEGQESASGTAQNFVKSQEITRDYPAAQDEETMTSSSDSDYVPSQEHENSLEECKNDSGSEENEKIDEEDKVEEEKEEHVDLGYQIPAETLRAAMLATPNTRASFWSAQMYRGPKGQTLSTHYCRTKEIAERVAQYFLVQKVVGFDIEWKPRSNPNSIKLNASLIQLACEDRIALFHISQFPGTTAEQLMPPTLKTILESPDIYKVGVAVKGDFTRLQKYLDVQAQGVFELSRLHNLVEGHGKDEKKAKSNKLLGLADQVHQHLQLPLYKGSQLADDPAATTNVRESDWSKPLNPQQIHYAAADAYAGFRLYHILEWKRKQLRPTPPTRGICDYDAKPKPKPADKDKATTKAKDDSVATQQVPSAVELSKDSDQAQDCNVVEEEEDDDEEGYETAPEEAIDSHELEDTTPSSVIEVRQATASTSSITDERTGSQRRVGRVNMSWLRGPDVEYPTLPQESDDPDISLRDQIIDGSAHSVTDPQKATHLIDATQFEPREDEDDEFADRELEEVLNDLELDADGKLSESTSATPFDLKKNRYCVQTLSQGPSTISSSQEPAASDVKQPGSSESGQTQTADESVTHDLNIADMDPSSSEISPNAEVSTESDKTAHTDEYKLATTWAQEYLQSTIPSPSSAAPSRIRATTPHLRAYHLWYHQKLSVKDIARHLRDPPLAHSTVSGYILQAVSLERLDYDKDTMREVLKTLPAGLRQGRWKAMVEKVG